MKPQIRLWFLQTNESTIYGNNNSIELFIIGGFIWDDFKHFFCVYDSCTHPKYDAAKRSLFKVSRMLNHLQ